MSKFIIKRGAWYKMPFVEYYEVEAATNEEAVRKYLAGEARLQELVPDEYPPDESDVTGRDDMVDTWNNDDPDSDNVEFNLPEVQP